MLDLTKKIRTVTSVEYRKKRGQATFLAALRAIFLLEWGQALFPKAENEPVPISPEYFFRVSGKKRIERTPHPVMGVPG
jgi:hypothetical protein